MFDTMPARIVVLRQPERTDDLPADPGALRKRCLHPAEAWVMRRRAGRPQAPQRRLPVVARVG